MDTIDAQRTAAKDAEARHRQQCVTCWRDRPCRERLLLQAEINLLGYLWWVRTKNTEEEKA